MQVPSLDSEDQKFQRILVYIFRRLSFNAGDAKENMMNQEKVNETKAQSQRVTQDVTLKCEQVAWQLRVIGDNLERRFQARRGLHLQVAHAFQNNWQNIFMEIMETAGRVFIALICGCVCREDYQ